MEHYVQYHNSEKRGFSCFDLVEDESFQIVTNKTLAKTRLVGNKIWLIGGEGRPRRYYLCSTFVVDQVEEVEGEYRYIVSGHEGMFFDPPIFLNRFSWFRAFLKSQQNFSMGLRRIEKSYVAELERVSQKQPLSLEEDVQFIENSGGAGFGSADINRAVERAAVSLVIADYQQRGWQVHSVEMEKKGYDLLCWHEDQQEMVGVKGVRGNEISFMMTAGEVKRAKTDDNFVLYVVTSALSKPQIHRFTAKEVRERFNLEPVSYRVALKKR